MKLFERWGEIKMHGCRESDWTDGHEMNFVEGNILWNRIKIKEFCAAKGLPCPPECFLEKPPRASVEYMANLDQAERVKRLRDQGYDLTTEWRGK